MHLSPIQIFYAALHVSLVAATNPGYLDQGFYFSYTPSSDPVAIPVTAQCDTINITWSRSTATGPSPTAPYYLLIYTSTFIVPFTIAAGSGLAFNWQVPFAPGTQYQICMFDSQGVTGGCQDKYTVIPALTSNVSCPNVTFPAGAMDVDGEVDNGPLSQYGWIDQCTDLSVTPKNGTPPYTLTIAPTLHPPMNITSNDMSAINYTVDLSWASQFFISLVDSEGNRWSQGPLHSGGHGPTNCLALGENKKGISAWVIAVSAIAAFVIGTLGAILATSTWMRRRAKNIGHHLDDSGIHSPESKENMLPIASENRPRLQQLSTTSSNTNNISLVEEFPLHLSSSSSSKQGARNAATTSSSARQGASSALIGNEYHIEPFIPSGEFGHLSSGRHAGADSSTTITSGSSGAGPLPLSPGARNDASHHNNHQPASPPGTGGGANPFGPHSPGQQVYVVHHDGGRAPVTVFAAEGAEVVELPPDYFDQARARGGEGDPMPNSQQLQQQQRQQQAVSSTRQNNGFGAEGEEIGMTMSGGSARRPLPAPGQRAIPPAQRSTRQPGEARKPPRGP